MKTAPLKRKTPLRAKTPLKQSRGIQSRKTLKNATAGKKTANKRKSRPKSKSLAKLKKELDAIFSKYIRLTHADSNGNCTCYTCGKVLHWKQIQNGHFISRQYLATRWHEDNCRPQDVGCNIYGNGKPLDFEERLKTELGDMYVENMKAMRHEIWKLDRHWYEKQIAYYKQRVDELE